MIKICIEGWRYINHSYAMVNQHQLIQLKKFPVYLKHKDISYFNKQWNEKKNFNGFSKQDNEILRNIKSPELDEIFDITYRVSFPYNFEKSNSKKLFVFGTSEYKNIDGHYINGNLKEKNSIENINIITPSKWSQEGFIKAGFKPEKVFIVPCGVDYNVFKSIDDNRKNEIKNKLGIKKEDFVITSVGAMTGNKGIDYLLAAFLILRKKNTNLKLILKDQSNLYNIKAQIYLDKIRKTKYGNLIDSDGLKNIFFISKNMDLSTLNELYNITDCYVSPYKAEGFNITPLEAAASGTPIVVTKGGSTDDYFDSKLGLQIESEIVQKKNLTSLKPKMDSLIECIQTIIDNPNIYGKEKASKFIKNNFSWYKATEKLYKIFMYNND